MVNADVVVESSGAFLPILGIIAGMIIPLAVCDDFLCFFRFHRLPSFVERYCIRDRTVESPRQNDGNDGVRFICRKNCWALVCCLAFGFAWLRYGVARRRCDGVVFGGVVIHSRERIQAFGVELI